jgi:hypothetical protein
MVLNDDNNNENLDEKCFDCKWPKLMTEAPSVKRILNLPEIEQQRVDLNYTSISFPPHWAVQYRPACNDLAMLG